MSPREDYFARVRPLLGRGLSDVTVRVVGGALALDAVDLLAGCMVGTLVVDAADVEGTRLHVERRNPWCPPRVTADADAQYALIVSADHVFVESGENVFRVDAPSGDLHAHALATWHAVRALREHAMRATPLPASFAVGNETWPWHRASAAGDAMAEPDPAGAHVMVVGCGSVGSELVRLLRGRVARWTLVDGASVTVFNLARQWFDAEHVGRRKVDVLAERLTTSSVRAVCQPMDDAEAFQCVLHEDVPDLVVLATGTHHNAFMADVLWRMGIPHVVTSCYPRAAFAECNVVLPAEHTPCHHCFRGHLYVGPAAQPAIPDEVASFIYDHADPARRDAAWRDLVAEPATVVETSLAAMTAARAVDALLASSRPAWLQRCIAEGTTVLLAGASPATSNDGQPAYGITHAGQVVRLGLPDLCGAGETHACHACGRSARIALDTRAETPAADPAMEDAALLGA